MWPSTVTRASKPVSCSSRGTITADAAKPLESERVELGGHLRARRGVDALRDDNDGVPQPTLGARAQQVATTSRSYGSSGTRIASAPPAIPAYVGDPAARAAHHLDHHHAVV